MAHREGRATTSHDLEGRLSTRTVLVVILLATVLTAFVSRDLWTPDEQRYGQVPREILWDGDWVVLHLGSQEYAEKPPLFFWTIALVSSPHGDVTSFGARLVGCLYAAGAFLVLAVLVRRWFDDDRLAITAVLIFATNVLVLHNATRAAPDLALAFCILLAVERGSAWLRRGGWWRALLFALPWAGGILVKGPLGLLVPLFAVAGEAIAIRRRPSWRDPGWVLAPVFAALLCLAWLLPALDAGSEAYRERLLGQIASRTSGTEQAHVRGMEWYLGVLAVACLPWTLHYVAGVFRAAVPWRIRPPDRAGLFACTGGGLVSLLLLFLAATKREVYPIPTMPFLAAAGAYALHRAPFRRLLRWGTWWVVLAPAVAGLACLALPFAGAKFAVKGEPWPEQLFDADRFFALLPAAVVFFVGFAWTLRVRTYGVAVARRAGLTLAVGTLLLKAGYFPSIDPQKSFQNVATAANTAAGPGDVYSAGPIDRDWLWNLRRTRIERLESLEALADALGSERPRAAAIVETKWWMRTQARLEESGDETLKERLAALRESWRGRAEHRTYFILTNADGP